MDTLGLVGLKALMDRTSGNRLVKVGLIDGPIFLGHPDLMGQNIQEIPGKGSMACSAAGSHACTHGTFVAGMLAAKRSSGAPAICPDCSLFVCALFRDEESREGSRPRATAEDLAECIVTIIESGVRVLNLSVALEQSSLRGKQKLNEAMDYAAKRRVIVVAAAGNEGVVGTTAITGHPWTIPVIAIKHSGVPLSDTNLGRSVGRFGLSAPGEKISSLGVDSNLRSLGGTSVAAPFVTGAIALLYSEYPTATAGEIKSALLESSKGRRNTIVPPLMDAWAAYQTLNSRRMAPNIWTQSRN